jgi:hypothetical protein
MPVFKSIRCNFEINKSENNIYGKDTIIRFDLELNQLIVLG